MTKRIKTLLVGLVAAGTLAFAAPAPAATDSNCASGYLCTWSGTQFTGSKHVFGPYLGGSNGAWRDLLTQYIGHRPESFKNRYTNRYVILGTDQGEWIDCLNPGQNYANTDALPRPEPGSSGDPSDPDGDGYRNFRYVYVSAPGQSCFF